MPVSGDLDKEYWTEEEGLLLIRQWLEHGLTDKQIAKNIGIHQSTLIQWKKNYEKLQFVFKQGRKVVNQDLENAMFKSCVGYYVEEEALDRNGNVKVLKRYIPPMSQTQTFVAKNWMPDQYKDKRDMNIEGAIPVILSGEDNLEDEPNDGNTQRQ